MENASVLTFVTKNGDSIIMRYPTIEGAPKMTQYINRISAEDTFITFSGEQLSLDEESRYLEAQIKKIEKGDSVTLVAYKGEEIVGVAGIERNERSRLRGRHIGIFGISVKKENRGYGIGKALSQAVIDEAKKRMKSLRMITLSVYKPNKQAHELYKKLGFRDYGVLPSGAWLHGGYVDEIEMYLSLV